MSSVFFDQIFVDDSKDDVRDSRTLSHEVVDTVDQYIRIYQNTETCDENERQVLNHVSDILREKTDEILIKWFPKYRCALIAKLNEGFVSPVRSLGLLGLESYEMDAKYSWNTEFMQTCDATSFTVYPIAPVDDAKFENFMEFFKEEFRHLISQDHEKRLNRHKRTTPAFMELVLTGALQRLTGKQVSGVRDLKGGWSEVPHHWGGDWALLNAVIEYLSTSIPYSSDLLAHSSHQRFLCYFQLWLLDAEMGLCVGKINSMSARNVKSFINKSMIMMTTIARRAVDEISGVLPVDDIERQLQECREKLSEKVLKSWQLVAGRHHLDPKDKLDVKNMSMEMLLRLKLSTSEELFRRKKLNNCREALTLSRKNIGLLPIFDNEIGSLMSYIQVLDQCSNKDSDMLIPSLAASAVQNTMYELSSNLKNSNFQVDIEKMSQLVDSYRQWNRKLLQIVCKTEIEKMKSRMIVEILSNEMLVMWSIFSLVHNTLKQKESLIEQYAVPLEWKDVALLVFSKKNAQKAALEVSAYLKRNSNGRKLFDLSNQDATLELAYNYASASYFYTNLWKKEQNDARKRESDHWDSVLRKKGEVERLQRDLIDEERRLTKLQSESSSLSWLSDEERSRKRVLDYQISDVRSSISSIRYRIEREKKPPSPVFQPLPKDSQQSLTILFFLYIPGNYNLLARLAISAQQILRPVKQLCEHTALDEKEIANIDGLMETYGRFDSRWEAWSSYFNSQSSSSCSFEGVLHPYMKYTPPDKVGPSDVMQMHSPGEGVWHPVNESPELLWNGGGFNLDSRDSNFFNPFKHVRKNSTIEYFTERVLQKNVQYVVTQYGELTEKSRSNQGIAKLNEKPDTLNKPQWLTTSSLRAYPNQQLRKLCSSLCDRNLKLDDPLVQILIRQTLFQIGDVVFENEEVIPVWKTDMFKGEFCDVISMELKTMGSELAAKPSQHKSLLMLIEIARYVGQWSDGCVEVLRDYLTIIKSWIDGCNAQIRRAPVKDIPQLRAKKGLFYHYAILCYSIGSLSKKEASDFCKMLVHAQNETHFEDDTPYDNQLKMMVNVCYEMMAERIVKLVEVVQANGNYLLSDAVREVYCEMPESVFWKNIPDGCFESACFEAVSASGELYSISLFSGLVLINGAPLSSLPSEIIHHPLYERIFGDRNFKTCLENGLMKTAMPIEGQVYSFLLDEDDLIVIERDAQTNIELRLLDSFCLTDKMSWGFELPEILKENYSHWYSENEKAVLFRGRSFSEKSVEFLMIFDLGEWKCFRIPSYRAASIWDDYLNSQVVLDDNFDQLVLNSSPTKKILEKFEDGKYIHIYKSPDGIISFHYARFDLEFKFVLDFDRSATVLHSRDYTGYVLSPCQQLSDTLWGFDRYLVLQHAVTGESDTKIVIPRGEVVSTNGEVLVETESCSGAKLAVYAYDVHPRIKCLMATSIHARIHLAHLYAACETLLPEERMKMCGSEVAMQLIRRSWTNQPLELTDYKKLQSIPETAMASPGLALLCYEVSCSSLQTEFLHTDKMDVPEWFKTEFPNQASIVYMQQRFPRNVRSSLTGGEELRVLGANRTEKVKRRLVPENLLLRCAANCVKQETDWADKYETLLSNFVELRKKKKRKRKRFIFSLQNHSKTEKSTITDSKLYSFMMKNLENSHEAHFQLEEMLLKSQFDSFCRSLAEKVTQKRENLESMLFKALTEIPEECGSLAANFRMFRSVNLYPVLTCEDLVKCVLDETWTKHFNPFLSESCLEAVIHGIKLWMKLCVLEDKMTRLKILLHESSRTQERAVLSTELRLLQELAVRRTWSTENHPQWLAFEVIAQLQIRPNQYTIAKTMIEGVENGTLGPLTQLNMGEGKTRVILPMLVMHWKNSDKLVRLNFLMPLLQEAFEYMHNMLCASIIGIPVLYHPFSRDVKLTYEMARIYVTSLNYCHKLGGVLLCAPEHRLSLKLKFFELKQAGASEVCHVLKEIDSFKYLDILDEVDEILRTKNKLIYAIGSQEQLASKESRWNVLQGLLKVVGSSSKIQKILSRPLVSQGEIGLREAKFQEFRILPGELFESVRVEFLKLMVQELVVDPPFELRWMKGLDISLIDVVIDSVTKPEKLEQVILDGFDDSYVDDILALRGFLANGLFAHCLMKRNRVDYGVNRRASGKKKLMAVPFHACETPALRAEFGHPDCALMYTCLAYYYDSLNSAQVEQAFRTLLSLGESAQADIYRTWFELSSAIMEPGHKTSLDSVRKLDLSNSVLVSLLVKYFSFNICTINFWLNSIIFPVETMQFPHRLEATAWDIAHNSQNKVAGFSGTNDERIIMPSSLKWTEQSDLSLVGTDGKMLQLLLKSKFEPLNVDEVENRWKAILDAVIAKTEENDYMHENRSVHFTRAFIDAGALMAGATDNEEVALYLVERLGQNYKGIVYFDLVKNGWWVRDKYGRAWPKHSSPIHERDGFVYFDESRTRGADMKLSINSRAILTLGPQMCKDKLMQAAGRMRMLEHGQKLVLMATKDVSSKIKRLNSLENANPRNILPVHVLKWVMTNTVNNVAKWLPEWAIQGAQFINKSENPNLSLVPDMTKLDDMYRDELQERPVLEVWERKKKAVLPNKNGVLTPWNENLLKDIDDRITKYGVEFSTKIGSNVEEECERELEKEVELEQEVQKEIPQQVPRNEDDWSATKLMLCSSCDDLRNYVALELIASFVQNHIHFKGSALGSYSMTSIKWPERIYGTKNFFHSCEVGLTYLSSLKNRSLESFNDYIRLVDNFLIFPTGEIVLLSEREADNVLKFAWDKQSSKFAIMSLTYARRRLENGGIKFQTPFLKEGETVTAVREFELKDDTLAALALFQGLVMFSNFEQSSLESILASDWAKEVAPSFCAMRGLGFSYSRSDLEILCNHCNVD